MLSVIRELLARIISDIDAGNSNMSEKEALELIRILREYTDKTERLNKYQACRYLNVSRATFDNYVREGRIPAGKSQTGFKEKSWSKKDLDNVIRKKRVD